MLDTLLDRAQDVAESAGAWKGRDKREPGARRKDKAETRLQAIIERRFAMQRRALLALIERHWPARKAAPDPEMPGFWNEVDGILSSPDLDANTAALVRALSDFAADGIGIAAEQIAITLDYTLTNSKAAAWARQYAYDLISDIDDVTRSTLRNVISTFADVPGMTIGDVVDRLPYDETRAERIAVTEVTRAYSEADRLVGEQLREEYPDVPAVTTWYTNNDDLVCPVCAPKNGKRVEDERPPAHPNCRCWVVTTTDMRGRNG